jgi:hypothetical protein
VEATTSQSGADPLQREAAPVTRSQEFAMVKKMMLIATASIFAIAIVTFAVFAVMVQPENVPCCANASTIVTAPTSPGQEPIVGVLMGADVDGVPVYRLPSITVSVNRKVELAKIAREDRLARAERDSIGLAAARATSKVAHVVTSVVAEE